MVQVQTSWKTQLKLWQFLVMHQGFTDPHTEASVGEPSSHQTNRLALTFFLPIQLLPKESLSLFFQECHKQATQGFKLHMPRGRYWRLRLSPGNFSFFVVLGMKPKTPHKLDEQALLGGLHTPAHCFGNVSLPPSPSPGFPV